MKKERKERTKARIAKSFFMRFLQLSRHDVFKSCAYTHTHTNTDPLFSAHAAEPRLNLRGSIYPSHIHTYKASAVDPSLYYCSLSLSLSLSHTPFLPSQQRVQTTTTASPIIACIYGLYHEFRPPPQKNEATLLLLLLSWSVRLLKKTKEVSRRTRKQNKTKENT